MLALILEYVDKHRTLEEGVGMGLRANVDDLLVVGVLILFFVTL